MICKSCCVLQAIRYCRRARVELWIRLSWGRNWYLLICMRGVMQEFDASRFEFYCWSLLNGFEICRNEFTGLHYIFEFTAKKFETSLKPEIFGSRGITRSPLYHITSHTQYILHHTWRTHAVLLSKLVSCKFARSPFYIFLQSIAKEHLFAKNRLLNSLFT